MKPELMLAAVMMMATWPLPGGPLPAARALEPGRTLRQCRRVTWTKAQGLPQNSVTAVLQTRDGFLWVGTEKGLTRFNGVEFTVFDARRTPELANDTVTALCEDARGRLWIGTAEGVVCLSDGRFRRYPVTTASPNGHVRALVADAAGNVWAGTEAPGLLRWREGADAFRLAPGAADLPAERINALCDDGRGGLWVGQAGGLAHWRAKERATRRWTAADGLPAPAGPDGGAPRAVVTALRLAHDGTLWVGTSAGLTRWREGAADAGGGGNAPDLRGHWVRSILEDPQGNVWVGTNDVGLRCFRAGRDAVAPERFTAADGLPADAVAAFGTDQEGGVWAGTIGGGLTRFQDARFPALTVADGLPSVDALTARHDARRDRVWVGTAKGLFRWEHGQLTPAAPPEAGTDDPRRQWVYGTYVDRRGRFWFGTRKSLTCLEGDRPPRTFTVPGVNLMVGAIGEDAAGRIVVNTVLGLMRLGDDGDAPDARLMPYEPARELAGGTVRVLLTDRAGNLWAGTSSRGLIVFPADPVRPVRRWGRAEGMPADRVLALHEDADGTIWLGTDGGGLCRLRPGADRPETLNVRAGLPNDVLYGVFEDAAGQHLWLTTSDGIARVAKAEVNAVLDGRAREVHPTVFGEADGMPSAECTGGCWPAGCQFPDGRLWVPTEKGMVLIDPARLKTDPRPPPVRIERLTVDDEPPREPGDWPATGLRLGPGVRRLEFAYAGLSFAASERVRYRYRLEGFERDWVEAGPRRSAFYTALPPGNYRFQVLAANGDGVWNEAGAALVFALRPRFFQTGWFAALVTGGVLAAAAGAFWLRQRRLQERFAAVLAERTRIARELHDTLAQALLAAGQQLDLAEGDLNGATAAAAPTRRHLHLARTVVRQGLADARTLVASLRGQTASAPPEPDVLGAELPRCVAAANATGPLEVRLTLDPAATAALPGALHHEVLRICQEAIQNALKHSRGRCVEVTVGPDPGRSGWLTCRVEDDGRGFTPGDGEDDAQAEGYGLRGMQERAAGIGGELRVESAPGQGTRVRLCVPLGSGRGRGERSP